MSVIKNLHSTESGLTSHQRAKFLGSDAPQAGSPKDEDSGNGSGNDVVKSLTLSFDAGKTHDENSYKTTYNKSVFKFKYSF
jgi:hypothetical protein